MALALSYGSMGPAAVELEEALADPPTPKRPFHEKDIFALYVSESKAQRPGQSLLITSLEMQRLLISLGALC